MASVVEPLPAAPGGDRDVLTTRFVRRGEFVTRNIAGETILVPIRGRVGDLNAIYSMDEVARSIWERIDGEATVGQIVSMVCAEFEVTPETAEADAMEFVVALRVAGLVEPFAPPVAPAA